MRRSFARTYPPQFALHCACYTRDDVSCVIACDRHRAAGVNMIVRIIVSALAVALLPSAPATQEALVTYKSLNPELALDLARAALAECRKRGYQVAVAVTDRFGVPQVMLRDRFAGAHIRPRPRPARPGPRRASAPTRPEFAAATTKGTVANPPCATCPVWWFSVAASSSRREARSSVQSACRARRAAMPTTPAPKLASTRCATGSILVHRPGSGAARSALLYWAGSRSRAATRTLRWKDAMKRWIVLAAGIAAGLRARGRSR